MAVQVSKMSAVIRYLISRNGCKAAGGGQRGEKEGKMSGSKGDAMRQ
jgi:hypothetical protein